MKALLAEATWTPKKQNLNKNLAVSGSLAWKDPQFSIIDKTLPAPRPDELLVRVKYCGICGSDLHVYETDPEGYIRFSGPTKLPIVLGHELSGEVVEVGKEVKGFFPGDIITTESILWCGHCTACRTGMPNQCENVELLGLTIDGGFAEYLTLKANYCWKLNHLQERYSIEEIYKIGTLIEPIGCAYNGIFISGGGLLPGAFAIVYGVGAIGLGAVMLLKAAGAAIVIAVDSIEERLQIAKLMGADYVYNIATTKDFSEVVQEITGGWGVDIQVEAAGAAKHTIPMMQRNIAKRGKIIYLGRAESEAFIDLNSLVSGAHTIVGSRGHSGYGIFNNVITMIHKGKLLGVENLVTSSFPFRDILNVLEFSRSRKNGKILIDMHSV
ncbi:alcohol dehydrogenase catalytic domain-containing protein [Desmonostoc muscorum LEGE 12446]|uniref:Alcohol dehydrogenase catalytic domain-containing protein n=1 Tax=Desmonostoc muscorum LEGE 12446 TaxID=1828758 RepID=A0A8J6ZRA7_DESMC|nr:scyllo-inosose 3-dehydrogenase [Desmonostoc muscorum]MCF2148600.1 alcohol dehydrogenase catalytic domain-containing protein [Desmonostoc muscorum LEGE 12446]